VDITAISDQDFIEYDEKTGLRIGAQTKVDAIANSVLIQEKFPFLAEAAGKLAPGRYATVLPSAATCAMPHLRGTHPALIVLVLSQGSFPDRSGRSR